MDELIVGVLVALITLFSCLDFFKNRLKNDEKGISPKSWRKVQISAFISLILSTTTGVFASVFTVGLFSNDSLGVGLFGYFFLLASPVLFIIYLGFLTKKNRLNPGKIYLAIFILPLAISFGILSLSILF